MLEKSEILETLPNFYGTEKYYTHRLAANLKTISFYYTDGIDYLTKSAECFWLLDLIASHQKSPYLKVNPFQVWTLTKTDNTAVIKCTDGNSHELAYQFLEYTSFPLQEITLYLSEGSLDGINTIMILLLPGEY